MRYDEVENTAAATLLGFWAHVLIWEDNHRAKVNYLCERLLGAFPVECRHLHHELALDGRMAGAFLNSNPLICSLMLHILVKSHILCCMANLGYAKKNWLV